MDLSNFEQITGKFTYTVFKSETYMVSSFEEEDGRITVTGPFFNYDKNTVYTLYGSYVDHPRFGIQFNYVNVEEKLAESEDLIINYLSSDAFKGVGKKAAEKIYKHFGDQTLILLKENPELISELELPLKQQNTIIEVFKNLNDPKNEAIFKLISGGFSSGEALRIYDRFKAHIIDIFKTNPYRFYLDIYGIPFHKVAEYCKNQEFDNKYEKYKEACLVYIFKEVSFSLGDTYLTKEDFLSSFLKNFPSDDIQDTLNMCLEDHYLELENDKYYLYSEFNDELFISDYLKNDKSPLNLDEEELNYAIDNLSSTLDITYDDDQILAIKTFFRENISIITGGPGSGKTTVVKSLVNIFKNHLPFYNIVVVAPTGRAAKRISEICEVESKTIHSLLRWDKETNTFAFNEENPILYDAVIIDEFSMVDNFLFASLLKSCSEVKKFCLIGDNNQLPSIRQGNLLEDLIDTHLYPVTSLKYNHRQSNGSEIIDLSYSIIDENVDLNDFNKDVEVYSNLDFKSLIALIDDDIYNGYFADDIQILAPMYKGNMGIDNLNMMLQDYFNPKDSKKREKEVGKVLYREGDKILQLKNRPNDDVYNGDIGILEEINFKDKYFLINFQDTLVLYKFDDLQDITLAYAMSVHKAQGSEYKIVYFIVPNASKGMLNKKLVYTAVTRAKEKLKIIGNIDNFKAACCLNTRKRKTSLKSRLLK